VFFLSVEQISDEEERNLILWSCDKFIEEIVRRWGSINMNKSLSSPRRIGLLHESKTVEEFKQLIN